MRQAGTGTQWQQTRAWVWAGGYCRGKHVGSCCRSWCGWMLDASSGRHRRAAGASASWEQPSLVALFGPRLFFPLPFEPFGRWAQAQARGQQRARDTGARLGGGRRRGRVYVVVRARRAEDRHRHSGGTGAGTTKGGGGRARRVAMSASLSSLTALFGRRRLYNLPIICYLTYR